MANGGGHVNRKNSKLLKLIGIHILAVAVVIPIIFPVYWLVVSALQSPQTVTKLPPSILPQTYSLYLELPVSCGTVFLLRWFPPFLHWQLHA